jgi:pimeloyl-ACP methyl ester carboxylesterase
MKAILSLLSLALGLYVLVALALYTLQRKFVFHPTPRIEHSWPEVSLARPDTPGQSINLIVLNPDMANALIYFGGNAESVAGSAAELSQQFAQHTVYLVNYPGYGGSDGSPGEQALFTDATLVFDHVASKHASVSALGRSLGSGVVCWLATQRKLARVVLVTPFDSILQIAKNRYPIFPVKWLLKDHFASVRYAPDINVPVLVVSASDDRVIPAASTERLIDAFVQPVESVVIKGAGHNDVHVYGDYYASIKNFIQRSAMMPNNN